MADEYASGEYRYWHLSVPSPELTQAIDDGWFPTRGRVLDLGCGAGTEVGFLAGLGATSVGIDLSVDALTIASAEHGSARFVQADATQLPFAAGSFEAALDRGCLHYLPRDGRARYAIEVALSFVRVAGSCSARAYEQPASATIWMRASCARSSSGGGCAPSSRTRSPPTTG